MSNKIQFKSSQEIDGKQSLLLIDLTKFYCDEKNIIKFKNIIENKSKISLRLIDWFVTNYSKKKGTMYPIQHYQDKIDNKEDKNMLEKKDKGNNNENNNDMDESILFSDYFCVFSNYKGQLKSYHKKNFDPFCRNIRIHFYYDNNNFIITTVGQLNFFKWAIENNILNYIEQNLKIIEEDMNLIANIKNENSGKNKHSKKKLKKKDKNKTNKNNIINNDENNVTQNTEIKTQIDTLEEATKGIEEKNIEAKGIETKDKMINEKNIESDSNLANYQINSKINKGNKKIVVQKNNTQKKNVNIESKGTQRRKRRELSESASKSLIKHNCKTVITFD